MRRLGTIVLVAFVVGLTARQPILAQPAPGSFVRVATWEDTATTLPARAWIEPAGIDIAPSGKLFVTDARLRRVEVLDSDGQPLAAFGRGPSPADLVSPAHVAVDEGRDRVYVADSGARRLAVYTAAGVPVTLWSNVGTPVGVAVAPDGRVVVTDVQAHRVHVLAPDGAEIAGWGGQGTAPTQLSYPAGVHVADDGTVWVADQGNRRLVATTLDGKAIARVDIDATALGGAEPLDVAIDGEDLWVATDAGLAQYDLDNGARTLHALVSRGTAMTAVTARVARGVYATVEPDKDLPGVWRYRNGQVSGDPAARWGVPVAVPGFFDRLESIAVGADGNAYLVDVPPRIQRFTLAGTVAGQIDAADPVEVDADASGQVYAAAGDTLYAYAADGTPRWQSRLRATGTPADDIAVVGVRWDATTRQVWVLEATTPRLFAFDDTGVLRYDKAPRAADPTHVAWLDLAVGPDGMRYGLDAAARQVRGWDAYDRVVLQVDLADYASRLDVGPDGTLFLLAPDGWLRQIGRDGRVLAAWDGTRLDLGRGSRPVDLAVDAAGKVYVADEAGGAVTVYAWSPKAVAPTRPTVNKGCHYDPQKVARPDEIPLGETVEVSLVVRGACAPMESAADIALLIDTSMERSMLKSARGAAESFLDQIDPAADQVAVQPGNNGRLTNDLQLLRRIVRRIEQTDTYALGGAISAAEGELFGRRGRQGVKKVIIALLGSSRADDTAYWEWWNIQRAAGQAKRRGTEIFAIAFGRNADKRVLYDIASGRDHVYESAGSWQLADIYRQIAGEVKPTVLLQDLVITDEIPANMAYVDGSTAPPATLEDRTLVWRLRGVPLAGIGVRYRLRPLEAGEWPTNVRAWGDYVDPVGTTGRLDFPVPRVRVIAPTPTPSATNTEEPTPTVAPAHTATPVPPPSPTPTLSFGAQGAFLPVAVKGASW